MDDVQFSRDVGGQHTNPQGQCDTPARTTLELLMTLEQESAAVPNEASVAKCMYQLQVQVEAKGPVWLHNHETRQHRIGTK